MWKETCRVFIVKPTFMFEMTVCKWGKFLCDSLPAFILLKLSCRVDCLVALI